MLLNTAKNTTTVPPTQATTDSAYCRLACSENKSDLFNVICNCGTIATTATTATITTTTIPTTTQRPVTCYYSTQRLARRSARSKRLYSSNPVVQACDYPGIIRLIWDTEGERVSVCTALLLDEDLLLVSEECYLNSIIALETYVMTNTEQLADAKLDITVDAASAQKLDLTGQKSYFYTVKISKKLTFDKACIQPVCFPNVNIPKEDIDFNDCRLAGYGPKADDDEDPNMLNEVRVTVTEKSLTNTNLTVQRVDKKGGLTCEMGDESAPLICSHRDTGEWITVGVTVATGFSCSTGLFRFPAVTSLLKESKDQTFFNAIQRFKYEDPATFPAGVQK
jgi:hypothetical protein